MSPLTRYRLRLILIITVVWVLTGMVIEINNALSYDPELDRYFVHFPFGNGMLQHLLITAVGPLIGGPVAGGVIVLFLRQRLQRHSFLSKQIIQSVIFLGLIFSLVMVVGAIQAITMDGEFFDMFVHVVFTWRVFRLMITWFLVVMFTLLILDVNEKYGQGVLWKIITGKYHKPRTEERIFMFMDLTNSTGLAEQMGDEKYFNLLRSLFFLTTEPVLNNEGEIYQYVGDEIIISWTTDRGVRNANCLRCFYSINETMRKHQAEFLNTFGTVPEFKAAVHMGRVVIGEIGVIKKDIVYAGDVLNSTARILDLSKKYGEQLLVSDLIYEKLRDDERFTFSFIDALILRGKKSETKVYGGTLIVNS